MKYAIKTRGTNSGNNPVGTIVYDLRGHESELQELRLLIDEYTTGALVSRRETFQWTAK